MLAATTTVLLFAACHSSSTSPTTETPTSKTASLVVTFNENPVPFRGSGCSASIPQGWYTSARLQETGGVAFTAGTLTQKLNGSMTSLLAESFDSRFGACTDSTFTQGMILANGAACGVVGICTSSTFGNYQFELTGTDANGHALTFTSPVLQFGTRPAGQSIPFFESSPKPVAPTSIPPIRSLFRGVN